MKGAWPVQLKLLQHLAHFRQKGALFEEARALWEAHRIPYNSRRIQGIGKPSKVSFFCSYTTCPEHTLPVAWDLMLEFDLVILSTSTR